jgi:hypothetical protein
MFNFKTLIAEYPFVTIQLRYARFDFFDDARFAPTPEELAVYPNIPAEILSNYPNKQEASGSLDSYYYQVWSAFNTRQTEIMYMNAYTNYNFETGPALPYLKATDQYPLNYTGGDLYTEPTASYYNLYAKGPMALIEVPASPKRLGFSISTFKEPVEIYEDLPTEGNELGDARYTFDGILYVWDGLEWEFGDDGYYEDNQGTFRARRDYYLQNLKDLLWTTRPFVWSAEYLPGYRLNKGTVFGFDLNDYVSMNIIGENESITLSMNNIEQMAVTFMQVGSALIVAENNFYLSASSILTIEYRKRLKELHNQFIDRMNNLCDFSSGLNGPYWQAMIDGNEYLTLQLRPAYVKNLKEAMASIKSLIEYASGSSIVYTTN